jgi:hypothetical protein
MKTKFTVRITLKKDEYYFSGTGTTGASIKVDCRYPHKEDPTTFIYEIGNAILFDTYEEAEELLKTFKNKDVFYEIVKLKYLED